MPVVVLMCLSRPAGCPLRSHAGTALPRAGCGIPVPAADKRAHRDSAGHSGRRAWSALADTDRASRACRALAWPAIAWAATGDIAAYTKTETVWRGHDLVPFKPWFDTGVDLFGPVLGVLAPFVFVALFGVMLFLPPVGASRR